MIMVSLNVLERFMAPEFVCVHGACALNHGAVRKQPQGGDGDEDAGLDACAADHGQLRKARCNGLEDGVNALSKVDFSFDEKDRRTQLLPFHGHRHGTFTPLLETSSRVLARHLDLQSRSNLNISVAAFT